MLPPPTTYVILCAFLLHSLRRLTFASGFLLTNNRTYDSCSRSHSFSGRSWQTSMGCTTITFFCSILFSIFIISNAADTLTVNQTISDGETIVSARGEFEMGFFSPKGSTQNRYFGIWYKKISSGTVIWVANREAPIANTSGIIRVSTNGIIVSTNESTDNKVWSSIYSRSVNHPVAQLLDTGNLVFRDENDVENFVWQSFDHLVDNFLPGMKFGVDLVSGINRYFLAWKSENDPSPGSYIHQLDPNGYPQLILLKDLIVSYRTGPWVGSTFSGLPNLKANEIYIPMFVISDKEIYYIVDLVNKSESPITRLILTPGGELQRLIWHKQKQVWTIDLTLQVNDCDGYGLCGAYAVCNLNDSPRCECMEGFNPKNKEDWNAEDWSDGCLRNVQLDCVSGDGFSKYSGVKLPDTRWSTYNLSMSHAECKSECLKDCNCTAYSSTDIRNGGSGCLLWFGELKDTGGYSENGQDLYVRMAASELKENKSSRQKKRLQIILIPVCIALTLGLGLLLWSAYKKRRLNRAGVLELTSVRDATNRYERTDLDLHFYDFIQITNATGDFSNNNKLGEGGFGIVYKGMLEGHEIAVKRLSKDSRQGADEFKNEVAIIAKLQHRNLVRLLGCCIDEGERMLIYEYMPNKGLDSFIFDKEKCKSFDWPKRYNIINGIARGLLYLHQDSRLRIVHRDLKASNILLDYEMNPKISDFGLARIFGGSETQARTTRVIGTYGYMPPEYAIDGLFSAKSDVYSFGVLLLEILSGKKNRGFHHPDHNLNLIGHVWKCYSEDNLVEVGDKVILDSTNQDQVFRFIQIGLLCVQEYPEDRPDMSLVVLMLSSIIALPTPKQPGFLTDRRRLQETRSASRCDTSHNNYSMSFSAPR